MADTIDIKIINDLKAGAGKMQESIDSSSLSREAKDINTAKIREALNILDKGANMTAQDLNRVSGILRSITQTLVKAFAGTEKVIAGLDKLQEKLQKALDARETARNTQKELRKHKIKVNDETGEVGIRKAEVSRMLKDHPVKNSRGENYTSPDAVMKAAEAGNKAAQEFMELVKKRLEELKSEYIAAKGKETTADTEVRNTTKEIDDLKAANPTDSIAVQMQEFGNELQNLIDKLKAMADEGGGGGGENPDMPEGDDDDSSFSAEDIDKVTKAQDKQNSSLGKAFKQFTIYAIALRTVKKALKEAVTTVRDLDKYLTEQAMVTGKTRQETYGLLKQYQQMAGQLGATTKEVAQVATQFMRQGKTTADSLTLTNAAISAAKVAGISAAESVDYLTTALNGFQLSAENAMAVSDKFAAIAAQSATSYEEIATALSKVAAQANLAGMSIDYTTALLAKGIETTREAPETIGTALKTVIARMRELGDYGETLGGDTDINNVESQLAYVGIALRDTNGELRSTEEVLDELGHKWDDLNSNQQAAIAKALAGTRQQSRLIAMMNDYERVVELQEIAQRSQGATLAQMAVYTEGMEAAINKVSVAWEKIVTAITDSELIIDALTAVAEILNGIGEALETTAGMVGFITLIAVIGMTIVAQKLAEWEAQKAINRAALEKQELALKERKTSLLKKKDDLTELKNAATKNKKQAELNLLKAKENKDSAAIIAAQKDVAKYTAEEAMYDAQIKQTQNEIAATNFQIKENGIAQLQNAGGLLSTLGAFLAPLSAIFSLMSAISLIQSVINAKKAKAIALTGAEAAADKAATGAKMTNAAADMMSSAGKIPYVGWAIAIAIGAAMLGLAIAGIASAVKSYNANETAEGAAKAVNKLSNEIYTLNKQAEALETISNKFEEIDNKVLKTNKDLQEMSELLDSAEDEMRDNDVDDKDDEGYGKGVNQKEYYKSLQSDKARKEFLDREAKKDRDKANAKRAEQLRRINHLNPGQLNRFMTSMDAESITARDAIYAMNNNSVYEYIDSLKTENKTVEKLTESLLAELDAYTALEYANNPQKIHALIDSLAELKTTVDDNNKSLSKQVYLSDVLTSDDYSIKDKTEAWREARTALQGNTEALAAFNTVYNEFAVFDTMGDDVLELIDDLGISVDKINDLAKSYKKLQEVGLDIGENYWQDVLETYAETGRDMTATIENVFGTYLNALGEGTEEYIKAYNTVVKVMENLLADSVLNIGQNMDKLKNSVSSIYEKANEWGSMSETERTEFLLDNAALFSGDSGAELLKAFETGNYAAIEAALRSNQGLSNQLQRELETIEERLKVEENRKGDEYNAALVKYLREQKQLLESGTKIFQASLEDRLALEEKQLDIYKDYLQKQQDALKDSLDKRKDAYQKYFDAINEEKEDEDYEEEANTLIGNLSKLSASDDASSKAQAKELEKKLEDLEKERLETLRERAQEQVLNNIDEEISKITERFDKLLETDSEILKALQGSINGDADFLTKMLVDGLQGKTLLEAEDYLVNTFRPAFGSVSDLSNIEVQQNNNGDLILNVAGRQINLSQSDSDDLSSLIYAALSRLGITTI